MKIKIFLSLLLLNFACSSPNMEEQKENLNGYWTIKSVKMPDGDKKDFGMSTVIDYIEIKGNGGIRTKVSPKFDGTFVNNGTSEDFKIEIEDDKMILNYKTEFDTWQETVLECKDSLLKVKNQDNKIYTYSRFKKFDLE